MFPLLVWSPRSWVPLYQRTCAGGLAPLTAHVSVTGWPSTAWSATLLTMILFGDTAIKRTFKDELEADNEHLSEPGTSKNRPLFHLPAGSSAMRSQKSKTPHPISSGARRALGKINAIGAFTIITRSNTTTLSLRIVPPVLLPKFARAKQIYSDSNLDVR
ncbi:hypothetical protein EVAR_53877_1 [Eumeta japonica]|uniref:Uncharacterized protein n=1 Tax=Eumeta variegata TaxID=151549 RepID=A0A4C1XII1_EUMVA|nr:hypothetical protein EVAR_53877_1 [Eumeta japonica]